MALTRRDLLQRTAAASALATVASSCDPEDPDAWPPFEGCDPTTVDWSYSGEHGPEGLFSHGVASGDPLPGAVVIWSRVTPAEPGAVEVHWQVSETEDFAAVYASGVVTTDGDRDHTVKVDVDCLRPGQTFWYRFQALGRTSPVGRTKTAPWGPTEVVRFGLASCSGKERGFFHAYRALAEADLDVVFHLGDYIYEYAASTVGPRAVRPGHELITLDDYRQRYASHREDPALQAVHGAHPFVVSMDDHESANNSWSGGAGNHNAGEGAWEDRKAAAIQAWLEWMPVRELGGQRMHRRLLFGDLLDVAVLDTRLAGRDAEADGTDEVYDPARQMLGVEQERWLLERFAESPATWMVLSQGVIMSQWSIATDDQDRALALNKDQWDGFFWARQRVLDAAVEHGRTLLVLTGDVHTSWANDLAQDFAIYDRFEHLGAVGVEAVTPGITSGAGGIGDLAQALVDVAENVVWGETTRRGFVTLEVTHERARAQWHLFEDAVIASPNYQAPTTVATWEATPTEPWWEPG